MDFNACGALNSLRLEIKNGGSTSGSRDKDSVCSASCTNRRNCLFVSPSVSEYTGVKRPACSCVNTSSAGYCSSAVTLFPKKLFLSSRRPITQTSLFMRKSFLSWPNGSKRKPRYMRFLNHVHSICCPRSSSKNALKISTLRAGISCVRSTRPLNTTSASELYSLGGAPRRRSWYVRG